MYVDKLWEVVVYMGDVFYVVTWRHLSYQKGSDFGWTCWMGDIVCEWKGEKDEERESKEKEKGILNL